MEVMETIVIQSAEVERKDKAASAADTEKTKAGEFKITLPVGSFHLYCSKQGGLAVALQQSFQAFNLTSGNIHLFNLN